MKVLLNYDLDAYTRSLFIELIFALALRALAYFVLKLRVRRTLFSV